MAGAVLYIYIYIYIYIHIHTCGRSAFFLLLLRT